MTRESVVRSHWVSVPSIDWPTQSSRDTEESVSLVSDFSPLSMVSVSPSPGSKLRPASGPEVGLAWSFATSWDVVYIKFRGSDVRGAGMPLAISPANKTEFLLELAERVSGLGERDESGQGRTMRLEP
jgi:hypothetical protein